MASGYTEEFFYGSTPVRNDELPPPYGDFIFRPPTRRPIVKTSKSFKDKKPKNKGKGPPSRMYATVRDPRIVPGRDPRIGPGHPLIHPDFITPQKLIPKIVPPQPKPVKPARSKSFNDNKRIAEQKVKMVDASRTYRCQSFPVSDNNSEDHGVRGFDLPQKVPYHPKQRLGLHEELFHPPSNLREPSSPPFYNVGPQQGLLFGRPSGNVGYNRMYVPSNESGTSLTLTELNQSEDEENAVPEQKPQKKKSTVRQILSSLFSSKKSSVQPPSKSERKKCKEEIRPVAKSLSSEITKEENTEEKNASIAASSSVEVEDSIKTSGKTGRLSAKITHQNEKQDQIILELKKKNSCSGKDDVGAGQEEHGEQIEMKGEDKAKVEGTDKRECYNGVQEVARQSDIVDTRKASNGTGEKLKKSHSVPSDLFKRKSRKSENVSGNEVFHKADVEFSKSLGEFIRMNQQKNESDLNNTEGTVRNKQNDSPGISQPD
ncbi:uncharacterized protein LOC134250878 [Saccostrea cucullata]|uniref:uncharacterized protein LOC134250878 n=1 Tax=Saccostrea cuccullata TaxID=36930 RepID=UPI002ED118E5